MDLAKWMLDSKCVARDLSKYRDKLIASEWSGENMWKLAVTLENPGLSSFLGVTPDELDAISEAVCRECEGNGCLGYVKNALFVPTVTVDDGLLSSILGWLWSNMGNLVTVATVFVALFSAVRINNIFNKPPEPSPPRPKSPLKPPRATLEVEVNAGQVNAGQVNGGQMNTVNMNAAFPLPMDGVPLRRRFNSESGPCSHSRLYFVTTSFQCQQCWTRLGETPQ